MHSQVRRGAPRPPTPSRRPLVDPCSGAFLAEHLRPAAERARAGARVVEDLCAPLGPWVAAKSRRIARQLPALDPDEVSHLMWMAVLDAAVAFDPDHPRRFQTRLRHRLRVLRADAVRSEIGRTGKHRIMSVPIEWLMPLPVEHLFTPADPLVAEEDQQRVEALLDRLPPALAGRTREAMAAASKLPAADAALAAAILGEHLDELAAAL